MKRFNGILAGIIAAVFGLSIAFSGNIGHARAVEIPTPVISGLGSSYMTGSRINLKLTSKGTTRNVQYRAVLTNNTTKKTVDLLKGYTTKYYNPKAGFPLSFTVTEGGKYSLSVMAKPGGYKTSYARTVTKTFNVISNANIIESVSPISVKVNVGEKYELPSQVEAKMKDTSTRLVDVKWDDVEVNTDEVSVKTYYGSVDGYKESVMLTVNVVDEKIVSIDDVNAVIDEGAQYKLPEKVTAKLNSGTTEVSVKWDAQDVDTSKPGTYKFKGRVDGYNGEITMTLVVNPVKFKVISVKNSNLREVIVGFNKKIDKNSVRDVNIRLFKGTFQIPVSAEILEDQKSAALSITTSNLSMDNQGEYTVIVENVKDLNGGVIEKYSEKVLVKDVEAPKVNNVYFVGPKTILVEFSEPIKYTSTGRVELKNGNNYIGTSTSYSGYDTNTIRVSTLAPMTVTALYNVTVKGFKDFAGYENVLNTSQFKYNYDKAPIITELKYADETSVMVEFSKEVSGITREHFYNNVPGHTAIGVYKDSAMTSQVYSSDTVKKVWVKFYDKATSVGYPFSDTEQKLVINGKYSSYQIVDNWGQPFTSQTIPVKVEVDRRAPSVLLMEADTESTIAIEFDEDVRFTRSNIEIIDEKGNKIGTYSISQISGSKYVINSHKNYTKSTLTININDVYDRAINPNKMLTFTKAIEIKDKTAPKVERVVKKFIPGLEESIYVYFSEDLDAAKLGSFGFSIQSPTNYIMTKLTGKAEFTNRKNIVRVFVTPDERNKLNSGYSLFVSDIYDESGNVLEGQVIPYANISNYNAADNKPAIVKIEAVDSQNLVVTFNQYLTRVDANAFLVNGYEPAAMDMSINDEGNTVVKLRVQVGREFTSDLSGLAILSVITDSNRKIENEFGLSFGAGYYTTSTKPAIEERIPPKVKTSQLIPLYNNSGVVDAIVMEYTENIDATRLSALSYNVSGRTIAKVYTNTVPAKNSSAVGRYVIIELKPDSSNTNGSLSVRQVLDVYDMNSNKLSPDGTEYLTMDKASPVVLERLNTQIGRGETKIIRFSKDLNYSSRLIVEAVVRQATNGSGSLVFNWGSDGVLSITNTGNVSTSFNLSSPVKVTITDNLGNISYNVVIIGW